MGAPDRQSRGRSLSLTPPPPTPTQNREGEPRAWHFASADCPEAERRQAWLDVLARLRVPGGAILPGGDFAAEVTFRRSPMGVEFAAIAGTAQSIGGRNPHQPAAIWLVLMVKGQAELDDGQSRVALAPGDMAFAHTGIAAELRMDGPFELLFLSIPRVALTHRIVSARAMGVGHISGKHGVGAVLSSLLCATTRVLGTLSGSEMRPIELALAEFLVACLAERDSPALATATARPTGKAVLHRVCQTIESLLAQPDLSLGLIAAESGVSSRYIQKLFGAERTSFSAYVRLRRLERCRLELANPVYDALSISQISFNWGFNGSSHFSRAFRAQYGLSPRAWRKQALLA